MFEKVVSTMIMSITHCTACTGPVYLNTDRHGEKTSSDTHRRVDAEVTKMLREAYSRVTALLVGSLHACP